MTAPTRFETALREQFVRGIARDRRRRARRRALGAAAAAVALAGGVAGALLVARDGSEPAAAAALDIRRQGGEVVVRLEDRGARAGRIREELAEAGLEEVLVTELPVPERRVGTFQVLAEPGDGRGFRAERGPDGTFTAFRVDPAALDSVLELGVGRPAQAGEGYSGGPYDAYEPGGPLHCRDWWGQRVAAVRDDALRLGVDVRFEAPGETAPGPVDARWVGPAQETGPGQVVVFTTPERTPPEPGSSCPDGS